MNESIKRRTVQDVIDNPSPSWSIAPADMYPPLLTEHAFRLSEIKDRLDNAESQINTHLIYLIAFEPTQVFGHWCSEISAQLVKISNATIKGRGRIPAKLYMHYMWVGPFEGNEEGLVADLIRTAAFDKADLRRNRLTNRQVADAYRAFHEEAADIIASAGDVRAWIQGWAARFGQTFGRPN